MRNGWDFGSFQITKRELAASVTIIAVMLLLGFVITGKIERGQMDKNSEYYKAAQITDTSMFQYGMNTDLGNAFVYGDLEAVDSVTYPEIGGMYMYVEKIEEHYNMHTRTYTTTDSKGRTQTHTEVYWSWDYAGSEEIHSQRIRFLEVEMDYVKIQMPSADYIETIKKSSHVRYKYYGCGTKYTGTIYADLRNGTIPDGQHFYDGQDIETVIDHLTSGIGIYLFWIIWVAAMGIVLYGFFYLDNTWLEN